MSAAAAAITAVEPIPFRTCAEFVASVVRREAPDHPHVQICVLSAGFDVEAVLACLLQEHMKTHRSHRRLYCVVVPDHLAPGKVSRFARFIEHQLTLLYGSLSTAPSQSEGSSSSSSSPASASAPPPPVPVAAIEEGMSAKERCTAFQRGGVVLLTCRSLCADLLHRRLAVELIGATVFTFPHSLLGEGRLHDALAPQTAFSVELLLRSGTGVGGAKAPPPLVLLSDMPILLQSLVQRHHLGTERFVQQLHVGDIQLFPRFRLDFIHHFEALEQAERPLLAVDRVVAQVSASASALDGLLAKILVEILQELQRLEAQLTLQRQASDAHDTDVHRFDPTARRAAAAVAADEDDGALRFLPRARLTRDTANGHLNYGGYERHGGAIDATPATSSAASYVRQSWRVKTEHGDKDIYFRGISEAAALSLDYSDLDGDLRAAVRRCEVSWPYRLLVESLIDVRRLRRATRGTAYTFLLQLESTLERRRPRSSVYGTGVTPPAALWTLSSHFHDVITVATSRIGTVEFATAPTSELGPLASPACPSRAVVVVDGSNSSHNSSEVEEVEVEKDCGAVSPTGGGAPACAAPPPVGGAARVPRLILNAAEHEPDVEVMVRLVTSWCRTVQRRRARHRPTTLEEVTTCPTLLLLAMGREAVVRYLERLTHTWEAYQQLQLCRFSRTYLARYGVDWMPSGQADVVDAEVVWRQATLFGADDTADASSVDADASMSEEDSDECGAAQDARSDRLRGSRGLEADTRRCDASRAAGAGRTNTACDVATTTACSEMLVFHQAILSQPCLTLPSMGDDAAARTAPEQRATGCNKTAAPPSSSSTTAAAPLLLKMERATEGAVTLCAMPAEGEPEDAAAGQGGQPRVVVLDATSMSATELTMLLDGTHSVLQCGAPSPFVSTTTTSVPSPTRAAADARRDAEGAPPAIAFLRVDRVVVARQQLFLLRQLEMAQDTLPAERLRMLKVQLITTTLDEADFKKAVEAERQAFESLAHTKATLTGTLLVDQESLRQTERALESGWRVARRQAHLRRGTAVSRLGGTFLSGEVASQPLTAPPCIVFDEREFRSSLPYELFRRGMQLTPLTLTTADYVLSSEYAVERKSVQDFVQSVMSGRIQHQLAALSRRYVHPLCLIEFHRGLPFRFQHSTIYTKTARLMAAYPRVSFLWARSPAHAAGMLVLLKTTVAVSNVDPADPTLTHASINPASASDVGGTVAEAAEREAAHYAARVLSRFPGITHQNAPSVLELCGSLSGLATIAQESLAAVMGWADAERLYRFLHRPFHEPVEVEEGSSATKGDGSSSGR